MYFTHALVEGKLFPNFFFPCAWRRRYVDGSALLIRFCLDTDGSEDHE